MTKGAHRDLPLPWVLDPDADGNSSATSGSRAVTVRSCFVLHLKPTMIDAYLRDHETVWPEMLDALRRAGWRNYTLFHRPSDGLVIGYVEADLESALEAIGDQDVNRRWQARMAKYFEVRPGIKADESMEKLVEYFHLD